MTRPPSSLRGWSAHAFEQVPRRDGATLLLLPRRLPEPLRRKTSRDGVSVVRQDACEAQALSRIRPLPQSPEAASQYDSSGESVSGVGRDGFTGP